MDTLDLFFEQLWQDYVMRAPQAQEIFDLFKAQGETPLNDHVAFRTLNLPGMDIEACSAYFLSHGYVQQGEKMHFAQKKLDAYYFTHPKSCYPKIFISHLLLDDLSAKTQEICKAIHQAVLAQAPSPQQLLLAGRLWPTLCYETYQQLLQESEYAAWFYVFGFCANHFTIFINALQHFDSVAAVNTFLLESGLKLNDAGGLIKGSPSDYLEQSSTKAASVTVKFEQGTYQIPGCYYEFAKRYAMSDGRLFQGFVPTSADKIFQSTDSKK